MTEEYKDNNVTSDQREGDQEYDNDWNYEEGEEAEEDYEGYYYDEETGQWILEEKSDNEQGYVASPVQSHIADQGYVSQTPQQLTPPLVAHNMAVRTNSNMAVQPSNDEPSNDPVVQLRPAATPVEAEHLRQVLDRTYAFEDYEPPSHGWAADVCIEIFVSLGFKVYFGVLIYCAGVTVSFICLNILFLIIVFLFNPISSGGLEAAAESVGFMGIFFFFSFVSTAVMCCWIDTLKIFWNTTRTDTTLWGISNCFCESCDTNSQCCSDSIPDDQRRDNREGEEGNKTPIPPWLVYLVIEIAVILLPLLIAMIMTIGSTNGSIIYFVQKFFFVVIIITMCLLAIQYLWFFVRAIIKKYQAYKSRPLRTPRDPEETRKLKRWFNSELMVEELGLDNTTLRWSTLILFIGLVPNLAIQTYIVVTPSQSNQSLVGWSFCVCLFVSGAIIMLELSNERKKYIAVFYTIVVLVLFTVTSFIGAVIALPAGVIALFIGSFVFSHFSLLRKHDHIMSRRAQCQLMNVVVDKDEEMRINEKQISTFFCAGKNMWFACCSCLDIRTIFGYRHPRVRETEKAERRKRCALRADFKNLLGIWFALFILSLAALIFIECFNEDTNNRKSNYMNPNGAAIKPNYPYSFCSANHLESNFSVVDFAALCATSRSPEPYRTVDRAAWFAGRTDIRFSSPNININEVTQDIYQRHKDLGWDEIYSIDGSVRVLLLHTAKGKAGMLRLLSIFLDAIMFNIASFFAPPLMMWANDDASRFIEGFGILNGHLYNGLSHLEKSMTDDNINNCKSCKHTVIVGDGVLGGIAKIMSSITGYSYLTFNAPDVTLSILKFPMRGFNSDNAVLSHNFVTSGSIYSFLWPTVYDVKARTTHIDCTDGGIPGSKCSSIFNTMSNLIERCGDLQGRSVVSD